MASKNSYNRKHFPDVELGLREVTAFAQSHITNKWWGCTSTSQLTNLSRKVYFAREFQWYANHTDFVEKNECNITPSPSMEYRILPNSGRLGQGGGSPRGPTCIDTRPHLSSSHTQCFLLLFPLQLQAAPRRNRHLSYV